jgi:hypothetical protein
VTTPPPTRWERHDLSLPEYDRPTEPPAIAGLIYHGKRHAISGPPEAAKTLVSLIFGLEHHRDGGTFALIDFEMGGHATRLLLNDLGATIDEIRDLYYIEAHGGPEPHDIQQLEQAGVTLAIIDAAAGAYAVSDLDDNKRQDAEKFARWWIEPLWKRGITTITLDHVVKNTENRGKFSIGSERKLGAVDVHLGMEAVKQVHRGHTGLIKITTHKDRPGHLPRPTAAELELRSDPDTNAIAWTLKPPQTVDDAHPFRPTGLMEKVSRWLEEQTERVSRATIEDAIQGKREYVRLALDTLTAELYIHEMEGPRKARLYVHRRPYREANDTPTNDLAPTSPPPRPGEDDTTSPRPSPPSGGGAKSSGAEATSPRPAQNGRGHEALTLTADPDADIPF